MTKKKIAIIITSIILAAALVTAGVFVGQYIYYSIPGEWTTLDEIEKYEGIFDSEFVSIYYEDDLYNVTFSDEDLLQMWYDYLSDLQVRRENKVETNGDEDGGFLNIQITTANGTTYSINPDSNEDDRFVIDGIWYAKEPAGASPYSETYALATERHGKYQNWDGEWVE
ncbi:MAG: hypothetical protein LUH43_06760 [Clostridia bacterium]|nr:hypothetical protein [Clostridia bacterium]